MPHGEVIDIFRYRRNEAPETNYLRWLCDDVGLNYEAYRDVAIDLLYYIFNDKIENDINRTFDAVALRHEFEDEYAVDVNIHNEDCCGLLEMMVALARRAADIMYDAFEEDKTELYFGIMFRNLGLDKYCGEDYDHVKVVKIMEILNDRKYDDHGKGGLWRVKAPIDDIRAAEIWSQTNWYLTEKWQEMQR